MRWITSVQHACQKFLRTDCAPAAHPLPRARPLDSLKFIVFSEKSRFSVKNRGVLDSLIFARPRIPEHGRPLAFPPIYEPPPSAFARTLEYY